MFEEPILWSDMVRVAEPWMKWAAEVHRVQDLPTAIRRAAGGADAADGSGVSVVADGFAKRDCRARSDQGQAARRAQCDRPWTRCRAAEVLGAARNPAILVGSRTTEADAVAELVAVAERIGAPRDVRIGHDARPAGLSGRSSTVRAGLADLVPRGSRRLADHDVILVVGMDLLAAVRLLRAGARDSRTHKDRTHRPRPLADRQELSRSKSG